MRRLVAGVFVVGLLLSCKGKKSPADVTDLVKQATVFVRSGDAAGSSFVVRDEGDEQYLLTNQHVVASVPEGGTVEVTYFPGAAHEWSGKATVVVTDSLRDLALLRTTPPAKRPAPLAGSTDVRELMPVIIAGFPFGDRLSLDEKAAAVSLSRASISALRTGALGSLELLQLDNNINPGNSGGPVIDEQGAVVGVSVAAVRGAGIGFVIPWEHASALLEGRAFEPNVTLPPCSDPACPARVEVAVVDPFRKTKRVELRVIEADDQFLQSRTAGARKAEGELLATAARPPSGALTLVASREVRKGKRYFLQLGFESSEMVYGAPFELVSTQPPAPEARPPDRAPPPTAEGPPVKHCWTIAQVQEIGTHINGELMLMRAGPNAEGTAQFEGHPLASVSAAFNGSRLRMVLTYPNGTVGLYEGFLDKSGALVEGTSGANTGASASWTGKPTACR